MMDIPGFIGRNIKLGGQQINLYDYQKKILNDMSDFRIINKARQIGITQTISWEALVYALAKPKELIGIISVSERMSKDVVSYIEDAYFSLPEQLRMKLTVDTKQEKVYSNGSRILSLPNNPRTVRGKPYTRIYFDEVAHYLQDKEIMDAALPGLSRGGKATWISTPLGKRGEFYRIWTEADETGMTKYELPYTVCPDMVQRINLLRGKMDEERFQQEYCYHKDTEFLTENGWKKYYEIKNDKIGCYDSKTNNLVFLNYTDRTERKSTDMIAFGYKNKDVLIVTPEHRVYHSVDSSPDKFIIEKAEDCRKKILVKRTVDWNGEEIATIKIPKKINRCNTCGHTWEYWKGRLVESKRECGKCWSFDVKTEESFNTYDADDFLRLVGYVASEGCINQNRETMIVSQKTGEKSQIMGLTMNKFAKPMQYKGYTSWQISGRWLYRWFRKNVGIGAFNKEIPQEFMRLSKRQLKLVFDALILGDGWKETKCDCLSFGSRSKKLADNIMEIGFKLGYVTHMRLKKDGMYQVSFHNKGKYGWQLKRVIKDYNDMAYCFTVPTGLLITRFNGRISIQGNCCKFLDETTSMFPYEMIMSCVDDTLTNVIPKTRNPFNIGVDFGKKIDSSVVVGTEHDERMVYLRHITEFKPPTTYTEVTNFLIRNFPDWKPTRISVDQNGPGEKVYEDLRVLGSVVRGEMLTRPFKETLISYLKALMQDGRLRIPRNEELISQLHSLQKVVTDTGVMSYRHPTSGVTQHDDYVWALALAVYNEVGTASVAPPVVIKGSVFKIGQENRRNNWPFARKVIY
jgi:phage FluMu gp28-like protein